MDLFLINTVQGLKPLCDDDFEEKKKLRIGQTYKAKVTVPRNLQFHRKYWSMITCAWDLLTEKQREFFGNKESFRKTVQISAGHFELVYNVRLKDWVEIPKSISFGNMEESEFKDLYERVRDVLFRVFLKGIITEELFEQRLANY